MNNDFFMRMCKDAMEELASGGAGTNWRDIDTNTLLMAAFGMLYNRLVSRLAKPLWLFAGSIFAGVVAYVLISLLTH